MSKSPSKNNNAKMKKSYGSVPHSWLIGFRNIYKIKDNKATYKYNENMQNNTYIYLEARNIPSEKPLWFLSSNKSSK